MVVNPRENESPSDSSVMDDLGRKWYRKQQKQDKYLEDNLTLEYIRECYQELISKKR